MKKIVSLILTIALLFACGAASAIGTYLGELTVVNCNDWVTMRTAPSTNAGTVCRVPKGELVEAYYYNSEFYECYYYGKHGYILAGYLDAANDWGLYDYIGIGTIVNCDEFVSMRSYPSTSASRVTTVAKKQSVSVYDCGSSDFYYCTYNGLEGYILKKYVSLSGSVAYGATMYVVRCDSWVTLRSYASTSASSLAKVPLGAKVTVYETDGAFTLCSYKGKTGYILTKYLAY